MSVEDPLLRLLARFGEEGVDGLLRAKTSAGEKDILDRRMLERIKNGLGAEE